MVSGNDTLETGFGRGDIGQWVNNLALGYRSFRDIIVFIYILYVKFEGPAQLLKYISVLIASSPEYTTSRLLSAMLSL
jgi:hypothetical protein